MSILDIIKDRRSIRHFLDRDIPEAAVENLVEAIRWAPSAGNLQSRKFYFVFNKEIKKKLAHAALNQTFIAHAPLAIVACADHESAQRYGRRGIELYCIQDVAASVQNMLLAAHELGLGSVWVGAFEEREVSMILKLPEDLRPVAIIPVGYPARVPKAPARVPGNEAVNYIK